MRRDLIRSSLSALCIGLAGLTAVEMRAAESWQITTVAGTGQAAYSGDGGPASRAQVNNPYGLSRGPDGALYVCEIGNHVIRRIDPNGEISTVAGSGEKGYSGDGGSARAARLDEPYEIRFDQEGNLYFVDMKAAVVRKVDAQSRIIRTVAGTGVEGFSGDGGPAVQARLRQPHSIQFDSMGRLYICDIGNQRIRLVDLGTGQIRTLAGTGERTATPDGGKIDVVPLHGPRAIDFDERGNLWLALREGNALYRSDLEAGTIHHVAGTGQKGFTGNGGPAKAASLSGPKGVSVGPDGDVYFADTESHTIRRWARRTGRIELVAGTGERGDGPEGDPLGCKMARPHGVFVDKDGAIYVGDSEAHRVRVIRRK